MTDKNKIFAAAIVGPTGVGKTKTSVLLAKRINAQIVSADSMQIYKNMDIGTAKASEDEMCGVKHYMLSVAEPWEEYNVVRYVSEAKEAVNEIFENGFFPLVVGGTGLYADALLNGTDFSVTANDEEYREYLKKTAEEKGCEYLHEMLEKIDKESAEKIHCNNVKRVIRALEIYHVTGKTKTENDSDANKNANGIECVKIGLYLENAVLYERINARVDEMIKNGLIGEVEKILKSEKGFSKSSSQAIGYREIIDYLNGKTTLFEATELLKRNSRRYAKRQYTWFMRDKSINWIDAKNLPCEKMAGRCEEIINNAKRERNIL